MTKYCSCLKSTTLKPMMEFHRFHELLGIVCPKINTLKRNMYMVACSLSLSHIPHILNKQTPKKGVMLLMNASRIVITNSIMKK